MTDRSANWRAKGVCTAARLPRPSRATVLQRPPQCSFASHILKGTMQGIQKSALGAGRERADAQKARHRRAGDLVTRYCAEGGIVAGV